MITSSVSQSNNILSSLYPFSVFVKKEWVNRKDVKTLEEDWSLGITVLLSYRGDYYRPLWLVSIL
jgi:hypothetical protein